jgi:hypothetical protein
MALILENKGDGFIFLEHKANAGTEKNKSVPFPLLFLLYSILATVLLP